MLCFFCPQNPASRCFYAQKAHAPKCVGSDCRKTYIIFKNGCLALLAMLVLHRAKLLASNQSVLALGVAPSRVRAAAPHSAPSHGEGVWGFGKDAEIERPKALCKDAYKWSNKVGAGRTDNKRPRLQRRKAHKAFL